MKKKYNKLSLLLFTLLLIFGCAVTPQDPVSDDDGIKNDLNINTLKSINVDKTSIDGSGTVIYTLELNLNTAEKVSVWGSLRSKTAIQEDDWLELDLTNISLTKTTYTGSYNFKNWEYADDYYLEVQILDYNLLKGIDYEIDAEGAPDSAFDSIHYIYDPWNSSIETSILVNTSKVTLTGTAPDITAPELTSVTVTPNTITDSGTVKVEIEAGDALSGIKDIDCYLSSPGEYDNDSDTSGTDLEIYNMQYNSLTGKYEGTCNIKNFHEKGEWIVDYICIEDNNRNESDYEYSSFYSTVNYTLYKYENQSHASSNISTSIPIAKITVN